MSRLPSLSEQCLWGCGAFTGPPAPHFFLTAPRTVRKMQSKIFSYFQRGGAASSGAAGAVEGARGTSAGEGGQSATQPTWALPKPVIDSSGNRAPAGASAPASDGPLAGFSPRFLSPPASPSWLLDLPRDFDVDALVATLRSPGAAPWQDSSHAGSGAGRGWSDIPDPSSGAGRGGPEPPTERTRRMSAHRRAVARHWAAVRLALDEPIASYRDLSRCIVRCAESSHVLDGDMGGRSRRGFRPPALDGLEQMLRDCFTEEERVALFGGGALPAMGPAAADQGASSAWWAPMAARGGGDGALGSVALPAGGGLLSSLCRLARRLPSAGLYDRVPLLVQDEVRRAAHVAVGQSPSRHRRQ